MKKALLYFFLLLSVAVQSQVETVIPKAPVPPRLVNDYTGTLSAAQQEHLESRLRLYDDTTSNQIVVVIVKELSGYPVQDYALALGRQWGVGNKEFNNGIVILVSTGGGEGNRDLTIEVGYGLESVIPDITAKNIINHEMIPSFRTGNIFEGLNNGIDALVKAVEGKYSAPEGWSKRGEGKGGGFVVFLVIIIIVIIVIGSSKGGKGGGYVSRRGYSDWSGGRGWIGNWPSSGGGWSGGGSRGGGFGGFGGGSFGGGGASGKW